MATKVAKKVTKKAKAKYEGEVYINWEAILK
jgi:hypothetical protein